MHLQSRSLHVLAFSIAILSCVAGGCASLCHHHRWPEPAQVIADPDIIDQALSPKCFIRPESVELSRAEVAYALAELASECEDERCVDHYFESATFAWQDICAQIRCQGKFGGRAAEIYQSSLNALIIEGQHYQRFDPTCGLKIARSAGWEIVPCTYHGFSQSPKEFNSLVTVGDYSTSDLDNVYRQDGLGVPTVVIRTATVSGPFQRTRGVFVATLLLNSNMKEKAVTLAHPFVLEFHNPIETSSVMVVDKSVPIAVDKSAAVASVLSTTQRRYFESFIRPGAANPQEDGLFMIEPYQPGKIPVVFIHGLLSDRLTWANMINELKACPFANEKYQFWGFQYPTGEPFLKSAATLRQQLIQLVHLVDPQGTDLALQNIVLVGHSMGGLVSKLLITDSNDTLWNSIAKCPFESVVMDSHTRDQFRQAVFFERSPWVSRVIFIGTPHRGSVIAQRSIGRLGSFLVEQPIDLKLAHRKLLCDNPGVFSDEFTNRTPTSIDILEPTSPLLLAIDSLPVDPSVRMHSIVGHGRWMPGSGDSDGVVPVSSARKYGVDSERLVRDKHTDLPADPMTIEEVISILREHATVTSVR